MADHRLTDRLLMLSRYYLIGFSVVFAVYAILVLLSYAHMDNIKNYCMPVSADEPHHIRISAHNACLIDWMYFIREPVFMLVFLYAGLAGPAWILFYGVRSWKKKH